MSITCYQGPEFQDRNGRLNSSVELPRMKGRGKLNLKHEIQELDDLIEDLCDTPCCFWACEGPNRPRNMITCRRCWNLRKLVAVRQTLYRSYEYLRKR